jgi:hypothetical protein
MAPPWSTSSTGARTLVGRNGGGLGFELDKLKAYWFCIERQPEI